MMRSIQWKILGRLMQVKNYQAKRNRWALFVGLVAIACLSTSCAGQNPEASQVAASVIAERAADPAGFWRGLLHGMIAIPSFIGMLFGAEINIYEVFNTGNWYNFGFLVGLGAFSGGSSAASSGRS
jgi:hypothetical protein